MNRSASICQSSSPSLLPKSHTYSHTVSSRVRPAASLAGNTAHCSYTPIHYEQGYAYPLIVWLHGPQSNEQEVHQVMPLVSARNHVAIAPRGKYPNQILSGAYSWGNSPDDTADAADRVDGCIAYARQQFNVHPERVFLAGYSTGGTLALRLAMEYPDIATGAISLGGPVPRGFSPLRRINEARKLPLMLSVSPNQWYTLPAVMDDLRLLHGAGFSLAVRLYPEGDELTTTMLADVNSWIMDQVCPQVVSSIC